MFWEFWMVFFFLGGGCVSSSLLLGTVMMVDYLV